MGDVHLDKGEQIILECFDAFWVSRNSLQLSHFVLTSQKMHCIYKKRNGLFKKPTKEEEVFYLSDIQIVDGEAQIFQQKEAGKRLLQMHFSHGVEKFYFPEMSKKEISQCISELHNVLDTDFDDIEENRTRKKRDGFLNSILKMEGKLLGQKTAEEYISSLKEKHYLLVKSKCIPQTIIPNVFDLYADKNYYSLIYNEEGECVFRVHASSYIMSLFDRNLNEVGSIEEHLLSLGVPFLEKNVKKYTVRFKGEELCQITACISMGLRDISCSGSVSIDKDKNHFLIRYKRKKLAQAYIVPYRIQKGHTDRFVIGYDDPEHAALATLLCHAYDLAETQLSDS